MIADNSEQLEIRDDLHHIRIGKITSGKRFQVFQLRFHIRQQAQLFHYIPVGAVSLAAFLTEHVLDAGIIESHNLMFKVKVLIHFCLILF